MPFSNSELIKLNNSQEELEAFPVEGELHLLFSNPIDFINIKDYIFFIGADLSQEVINISFNEVKDIGDVYKTHYEVIDYTYTFENNILSIKAIQPLIKNRRYYIVASKYLGPEFYSYSKIVSLGPSSGSLVIDKNANSPTEDSLFELVITQTSSLSTPGVHNIGYSLTKNGNPIVTNQVFDIKSGPISLFPGIGFQLNPNIPLLVNESFSINILEFTRSGITRSYDFFTNIDEDIPKESNQETLKRLSNNDIINFYEQNGYARRVSPTILENALSSGQIRQSGNVKFVYPGIIEFELEKEIKDSSLVDGLFNISISPAFDNHFLLNMGYFNPDDKYIIQYSLIPNDYGENKIIRLVISKDINNIVPIDDKFILEKV